MQAILCVLVIISACAIGFSAGLPGKPPKGDRTCKAIKPMKNLNEIRHQGPWIAYGGNIRCDGCCITYDLILKKPGFFIARNTNYTLSGPGKTVDIPQKRIAPGCYKFGESETIDILSTDYTTYVVAVIKPGRFGVYIRSLADLKDKCTRDKILAAFKRQSQLCGVKYYPYNVEKGCRKYKPVD